ncbi:uncharacterized protein LOC124530737 [Vanessa cardui]|uniref:uncharacterized protein LOC124530737 n=1 Tax=Vanessa cardui TaxID=171605 RepID=UPI001F141DB7|nr:uncharacterized protein LOC124530737 [Vanessa cardui]
MLITKTFFILVLTYSVTSSEFDDDVSQQRFFIKSYNYNHPPLLESYKDVPDANKFEGRKVRQVKSLEYEKNEDPSALKTLNSNSEIPVTVVYGPETESLNSNNNQQPNKIKRRKQTRRPNPIYKERKEEVKVTEYVYLTTVGNKESSTEKVLVTSPSPKTVVPKMFTKRPPEDNPVVKKIRQKEPWVKIVEESNYVYAHNGNFHYSFEGADGTKVSSEGELKSYNDDKTGEAVVGSVFYTDNEGNDFSLSYTADENGYRPHGAHLPTPPPIPPAIARALKHLATKTTPEPVTEATKKSN